MVLGLLISTHNKHSSKLNFDREGRYSRDFGISHTNTCSWNTKINKTVNISVVKILISCINIRGIWFTYISGETPGFQISRFKISRLDKHGHIVYFFFVIWLRTIVEIRNLNKILVFDFSWHSKIYRQFSSDF